MSLSTNKISSHEDSDLEELSANLDTESPIESKVSDPISLMSGEERVMEERALENGLDSDIYKVANLDSNSKWYKIGFLLNRLLQFRLKYDHFLEIHFISGE